MRATWSASTAYWWQPPCSVELQLCSDKTCRPWCICAVWCGQCMRVFSYKVVHETAEIRMWLHECCAAMQALSARSNAPECHIGLANRFKQSRSEDSGTGLFKHKGSVGPQDVSTKPSLPSYSLGASTRDQMYKVQPAWYQSTLQLCCLSVAATE